MVAEPGAQPGSGLGGSTMRIVSTFTLGLLGGLLSSSLVIAATAFAQAPPSAPPAASSADVDGETMFATSCGWCHQQGGRAPGRGPKLAGIQKDDAFIINRIKHGKPGAMPAFGRAFSDGQIVAILAYIRSLDDSTAGGSGAPQKP